VPVPVKSTVEISQNFVAFSEYMNFKPFIFLFQTHHKQNPEHLDFPHVLFDYHQEVKSGNVKHLSKLKSKGPFINDVNIFQRIAGVTIPY
jgi:hypothetical protein